MFDTLMVWYYFLSARRLMRKFTSRQHLLAWQEKQFYRFAKQNLVHSPYYKSFTTKRWDEYPLSNKQIMMDEFDKINTAGVTLSEARKLALSSEKNRDFSSTIGDITVGSSSGTSGKQGIFLVSEKERLKWAGIMLAKLLPGSILRKHKIAFFLRANSNLYETLSKRSHIQFKFFDLTQPMDQLLKELNDYQPSIVSAPASVLKCIAQEQEIKSISIAPRRILSVAETLDEEDQKQVEHTFSQAVFQVYQCTEGFLAATHGNGKIYLNEEYIRVEKEWVDKGTNRFVPIITDFTRTTQPIVRYRLDDVLIEDVDDHSIFSCLRKIEGRCDDVLYFEQGDLRLVPIFPDTVRRIMNVSALLFDDYQLIQTSTRNLVIQLNGPVCENEKRGVFYHFDAFCKLNNCKIPHITFERFIAHRSDKKLRRIQRKFPVKGWGS